MSRTQSLLMGALLITQAAQAEILIDERFDDPALAERGWYDLKSAVAPRAAATTGSLEFHFRQGAKLPDLVALRRRFEPTDRVYLRYSIRYSDDWEGSNKSYQPHQFYLLTNKDGAYAGPASTHLTLYVEDNAGHLLWAAQDALNIDPAGIGQDLTGATERRAIAGCNGSSDGHKDSCYRAGDGYRNWKQWRSAERVFDDRQGPRYKGRWHRVEAYAQLNSIVDGKAAGDGVLALWVDGRRIVDRTDAVLRTAAHSDMEFNQLIIGPYIGDQGSPVDQSFWIDDLVLANHRPAALELAAPSPPKSPRSLH